jgi:hypothetical protein
MSTQEPYVPAVPGVVRRAVDTAINAERQMDGVTEGEVLQGERLAEVARFALSELADDPDLLLKRRDFQRWVGIELGNRLI